MKTHKIIINRGRTIFIHSDDLAPLARIIGQATTRRASHVEPTSDNKWTADLSPVNGPILGPFETRGEALAAEAEYLLKHLHEIKH